MQSNHHSQLGLFSHFLSILCLFCLFENSSLMFFKDRFNVEDFDGEEEARPDYPCPYCYEELDIVSLCSHLEAEHSYESKSAVSFSFFSDLYLIIFLLSTNYASCYHFLGRFDSFVRKS